MTLFLRSQPEKKKAPASFLTRVLIGMRLRHSRSTEGVIYQAKSLYRFTEYTFLTGLIKAPFLPSPFNKCPPLVAMRHLLGQTVTDTGQFDQFLFF